MMDFRKAIAAGLAASAIFAGSVQASTPGLRMLVNGTEKNCTVPPVLEQGRALAPLRQLCEELGARVDFDTVTGSITVTKNGTVLQVKPGLDVFPPAFRAFTPQEAAQNTLNRVSRIIKGRTYVPVRCLAELLGAKVTWDDSQGTIKIDLSEGKTVAFERYEMTETGPVFHPEALNFIPFI